MPRVLFTRKLSSQQQQDLRTSGIEVVSYDAISIDLVAPKWDGLWDHAIFTSQNAVRSVLQNDPENLPGRVSCVGAKTAGLLREYNIVPYFQASSAADLCKLIGDLPGTERLLYFCGNRRLDTIPTCLRNAGLTFREVLAYRTQLNPRELETSFDAIAFMSPSAVASYLEENQAGSTTALCIGPTTAQAAKGHFKRIEIAETPTLEALISLTKTTMTA